MKLGAHMSIAGGVHKAVLRGDEVGCNVIQIFSKNASQWKVKPLDPDEVARFKEAGVRTGVAPVLVHNSYLINMASPSTTLWTKSVEAFHVELDRAEVLGVPFVVAHPGSFTDGSEEEGLSAIVRAIDELTHRTAGRRVRILLETTAGQGSSLGWRFEQIRYVFDHVRAPERLGLCLDTCHIFAAGYDIREAAAFEETVGHLDAVIGLDRVEAIHLNDAKYDLGSRKDRHEHIGKGRIGLTGFRLLLNDPRFRHLPMVLETPKGKEMEEDKENLAVLRGLVRG